MNDDARSSRSRDWAGPPGIAFNLATSGLVALSLYTSSVPNAGFGEILTMLLLWGPFGVIWLFRMVAALDAVERGRRVSVRRWLAIPLAFTLIVAAVSADLPFRARFELSRPALDGLAAKVMSADPLVSTEGQVGLFSYHDLKSVPGGVLLFVDGPGQNRGIAWFSGPPHEPDPSTPWIYEPLEGPWFYAILPTL